MTTFNIDYIFPPDVTHTWKTPGKKELTYTSPYIKLKESRFLDIYFPATTKIQEGDSILDLTGNIGGDTIALAHTYPKTNVISCEMNKESFECLKNNCKPFKNITCHHIDSLKFIENYDNKSNTILIFDPPFGDTYKKEDIHTKLEMCGLDVMTFIKTYLMEFKAVIIKTSVNWDKLLDMRIKNIPWWRINTSKSAFYYFAIKPADGYVFKQKTKLTALHEIHIEDNKVVYRNENNIQVEDAFMRILKDKTILHGKDVRIEKMFKLFGLMNIPYKDKYPETEYAWEIKTSDGTMVIYYKDDKLKTGFIEPEIELIFNTVYG